MKETVAEVYIGGDCSENCMYAFTVDKGVDRVSLVDRIYINEAEVTVILPNGGKKVFYGLPYQARLTNE